MWPHLTPALCFPESELDSETDILSFESQANFHAQKGLQKTERDCGVIYWELSQLSDRSPTQTWHDLYKRITARIVHTHNKLLHMSLPTGVFRCLFKWWVLRVCDKQAPHQRSPLNTQGTVCRRAVTVRQFQLQTNSYESHLAKVIYLFHLSSPRRHFSEKVALVIGRENIQAKSLCGVSFISKDSLFNQTMQSTK